MLKRKKDGPPTGPFTHTPDCAIVRADPGYEPPWQEIESGNWKRECQCTADYWHAPFVDDRVRLDPLDRAFARHAGECERKDATDPADLKMLLNVKEGMGEGYWWVTCHSCGGAWQVPHYTA